MTRTHRHMGRQRPGGEEKGGAYPLWREGAAGPTASWPEGLFLALETLWVPAGSPGASMRLEAALRR